MPALPPMTPEDIYHFRFLTDARISPDGARIAYSLRRIDPGEGEDAVPEYRCEIWLVPTEGGAPTRFVHAGPEDASPRWSPDGGSLAFVSDRGTPPPKSEKKRAPKQLYLIGLAGGEPAQLTDLGEDCADPAWSPRGDLIAFVARDAKDPARKDDGIKVYDRIRYKSDEGGLFDLRRRHVWAVRPDGSGARQLTSGDWDDLQPAISPDGKRVAFVSNRTAERDRNTVTDVWIADIETGAVRQLTDGRGQYAKPSWSPDGSAIACYGTAEARGATSRNTRVWVFSSEGGAGRDVLGAWDRSAGTGVISDMRSEPPTTGPVWSPDGERLYFQAADRGTADLYSVRAAGGEVRPVTRGEHHVVLTSLDRSGERFAAIVATAKIPADLCAGTLADGALRTLVAPNAELLASRHVGEPERVEFAGADGWKIEGWLLRPRGFGNGKRWPLVLEIHGGPHAAYGHSFFHEFQVLAGRGYGVLYTNPRGSQSYGEAFTTAVVGDWGGKDYEDLMGGVDHVLAQGWVDEKRLYVTGGSYGGFMTNWVVGHTGRFRAAVTQRSISNNVSAFGTSDIGWHFWEYEMGDATPWQDPGKLIERSPLTYAPKVTTPLLILHAEKDYRCPIEQAEQLFVALKFLGKEAVFVRFPEDTHDLTRAGKPGNRLDHCRRLVEWFDTHA